jgi:hypothetical protein
MTLLSHAGLFGAKIYFRFLGVIAILILPYIGRGITTSIRTQANKQPLGCAGIGSGHRPAERQALSDGQSSADRDAGGPAFINSASYAGVAG